MEWSISLGQAVVSLPFSPSPTPRGKQSKPNNFPCLLPILSYSNFPLLIIEMKSHSCPKSNDPANPTKTDKQGKMGVSVKRISCKSEIPHLRLCV